MQIDKEVQEARENRMWKIEYMSINAHEADLRREGRAQEREEIITALLRNGMSPEEIAKKIERPIEEVRKIAEKMSKDEP